LFEKEDVREKEGDISFLTRKRSRKEKNSEGRRLFV